MAGNIEPFTIAESFAIPRGLWERAKLLPIAEHEVIFCDGKQVWRHGIMALVIVAEGVCGVIEESRSGATVRFLRTFEEGSPRVKTKHEYFVTIAPTGTMADEKIIEECTPRRRRRRVA